MKDELAAICASAQYNGTCSNEVWELVNAVHGFEKADAIVKLLNEDNKNLEQENEYVTTLVTYERTGKEPICSFCKEPISIFSGCSNKNCVQHIKKEKYFTYGLGNKQIFPYTNINSVLIKNNNISNWAQILNSKGEKLHTYTYIATLLNGKKVTGEYESDSSNSQRIEVPEATQDNPMVSLLVQKKAKTIAELSKFKSICKNCNSKLIQTSIYDSWIDYLECPTCKTKVSVHHQDAMSGYLIDYVIIIEKHGTSEFIEVPFKD